MMGRLLNTMKTHQIKRCKVTKKDVHLFVVPAAHRLARIECAKASIDLSRATEALWLLWSQGVISPETMIDALADMVGVALGEQ